MSRQRLAVIGGNGFIGQEVVRQALARGFDVLTVDPGPPRHPAGPPAGGRHAPVSVADEDTLAAVLTQFAPHAAVNLAAYGEGTVGLAGGAGHNPARAVDVNVRGAAVLLRVLQGCGCRQLSWSSSSTVYGPRARYGDAADGPGVTEDAPTAPELVYGATKVGAEQLTRVLAAEYGIRAVGVRLPLVYGNGRWYGGSQQDLVRFTGRLAAGEPAHLRAWTGVADWMHVDDAARCLLDCATNPAATRPVYNASGHRSSLFDLATALVAAAGAPATAHVEPVADGAPDLPLLDTTRIRAELGFAPRIADPQTGARHYLAPPHPADPEDPR
ncbi:MAG TPA: NAD(P)-dependent oxidoreductase [Pseudonocardia sp.]|uniref:NAD-dependent epimerase/dehydratase family protein n=1 Tax=Pseudonocardia sp. TaxID=60912 RepID=UPI002B4B0A31|nr:NAD(P)-dependent oxidoreductase [Pseudonocardia sp.]HLU56073.1 NAD(P)-dependent oxidoreductase [Pseudonocardia sp.]